MRPHSSRRWRLHVLLTLGLVCSLMSIVGEAQSRRQEAQTESRKWTIRVGPSGLLDLSNLAGRITVIAGGGEEIQIEAVKRVRNASAARARDLFSRVTIDVSEQPGRLVVQTIYDRPLGPRGSISVDYSVRVPRDTRVELKSWQGDIDLQEVRGETRVESVSGRILVLNVSNLALARTVSGSIDLKGVAGTHDTTISTISGDLQVQNLKTPRLEVSSISGKVDLLSLECERLKVGTVSGHVQFGGTLARNGRYDLQSHHGNLRLAVSTTGFDVDASTFRGAIDTQFPIVRPKGQKPGRLTRPDRALRGVFEKGGAIVGIHTFDGNITIARK